MAGERRPADACRISGRSRRRGRADSSLGSSWERALVREYSDRFSAVSQSSPEPRLPRKLISPYASKTCRMSGRKTLSRATTDNVIPSGLHPTSEPCPQDQCSETDSAESDGNTSEPWHPTTGRVPTHGGRRAHSASTVHPRKALKSPRDPTISVFERQRQAIRVTAYKNGSRRPFARITASDMTTLLEECTSKLRLNSAARRVFLTDGREATQAEDIPKDADVYISTGQAFVDPQKEVRAHLSLSKEASWTTGGIALPADCSVRNHRRRTRAVLSDRLRGLSQGTPTLRVLAFKNGAGSKGHEVPAEAGHTEQFLDLCTVKLHLTSAAKLLYDWEGNRLEDISDAPLLDACLRDSAVPLRGPIWVSRGEWFSPAGAKVYIQGALGALRGRLQSAGEHLRQLELADGSGPEKVTKTEILPLAVGRLHDAREKVERLVEELRATIKRHQAQLLALAPLIRAEEGQPGGYVSQHVRPRSQGPPLPQGLQLKVCVNGQLTGERRVLVNRPELEKGCDQAPDRMMERLLQIIHQRMQPGAGYNPPGPRLTPTCLFDEQGAAIDNPAFLRNEQKVWVSYGEDYRPPQSPILSLAFERVVSAGAGDRTAVFIAPVVPEAVLPAGPRKWEACEAFPSSCKASPPESLHLGEALDPDAHFLQLKADPRVVLFPSATVVKQTRSAGSKSSGGQLPVPDNSPLWPLCHVWLITKAGSILSRAMPQLCLAISSRPVTLWSADGTPTEAYTLSAQKRSKGCPYQEWGFGKDGCIYPRARSEFVLTYLEDLCGSAVAIPSQQGAQAKGDDPEVSERNVIYTNQNKPPGPAGTPQRPSGAQGERAQLTLVLVRKRAGKHPQASAQRWAIRHEGIRRAGQWKHSKVENPLWNKLTYMWPTLPDGELNQDLTWPLEGALIPCAPPLTDKSSWRPQDHIPLRLRVMRNGEQGRHAQPTAVTAPNITNMLKKRKQRQTYKTESLNCVAWEDDSSIKTRRIEFQQFLERCTEALSLPFAARRLFDEDGKEISLLQNLQRDQLVYVSCGEQWVDPQLSRANGERRLLLHSLEQDMSLIRHFCAMRDQQDLVLEVAGELKGGSRVLVAERRVPTQDKGKQESEGSEHRDEPGEGNANRDLRNVPIEDSHTKAHRKLDEKQPVFSYPWQENSEHPEEDGNPRGKEDEFPNMGFNNMHRLLQVRDRTTRADLQKFEFSEGLIVSQECPALVLGTEAEGARAGAPLMLLQRDPTDAHQRWTLREEDRTLHLLACPDLVLTVSMPGAGPGDTGTPVLISGSPVVLQKYKPYTHGAANQKWGWMPEARVLSAFYTTQLDLEVTAATRASLCTACVSSQPLHQQGFCFPPAGGAAGPRVCAPCAKALRGRQILLSLSPDSVFSCSTARRHGGVNPTGTFLGLIVLQTDLSSSRVGATLQRLEKRLDRLRRAAVPYTQARGTHLARAQPPIKILARRNGRGLEGAHLITAKTMTQLLSECTHKLQLPRAASRLYAADGTHFLTLPQLKAWAVNQCLQEDSADSAEPSESLDADGEDRPASREEPLSPVTPEDLERMDEALLALVLRSPVDVWVSCGEPFLPTDEVHRREKRQRLNWQQKENVLADLVVTRHKMKHLQGRRISQRSPPSMVPTRSPVRPVVLQGGWTEPPLEEVRLMEDVRLKEDRLAKLEAAQAKDQRPVLNQPSKGLQDLYNQPRVKRLRVYRNGNPKIVVYAWGQSMEELLSSSTSRLGLAQPASRLYTADGHPLCSWADVQREALVCVSAGEPFLSAEDCKRNLQIRAGYIRAIRAQDPDGTMIELNRKERPIVDVTSPGSLLALPWAAGRKSITYN